MAIGVALVAFNLRPPITAVSPLLDRIQDQEGFSSTAASLLVTLPLICFVLLSTSAPAIGRRLGIEHAISLSLLVVLLGFGVRLIPATAFLFLGTAVIGLGVTFGNVLLPAAIKRDHPSRVGLLTGLYTMSLYVGAAAAAGFTLPLQHGTHLGWRATLGLWAVPLLVGMLGWLPQLRARTTDLAAPRPRAPRGLWRVPLAWAVALSFAMPTVLFYTLSAWLPTILGDAGMSDSRAGAMLSVANLSAIPFALAMPILASRTRRQVWCLAIGGALLALGLAGLLAAPTTLTAAWMLLCGAGLGTGTGLGYAIPLLRSRDAQTTAELSAFSQTIGYLLSALGPLAAGALHDVTHGWTIALTVLTLLAAIQIAAAVPAGQDTYITDTRGTLPG
ncbi:MFS transporter [Actinomadura sp. J1-007]|uniref:CynX/NimT family MFS transporter n=1 Tax=Actinomadura sp. J1-007 TaxID=2661913 RepID=UPI0013704344|nr:MFS transporter [Actinomadura sp. J1-007]